MTGSLIPRDIARSAQVPFDKKYDELTAEQKSTLAAMYEKMGPNDEPPIPRYGLKSVIKALVAVNESLEEQGILFLIVDVAPDGTATNVRVVKSPSEEMTRYAAQILILAKFKPALCGGVTCSQQYPFKIEFSPS